MSFWSSWYLENTLRARLLHRLQEFMPQPLSIRIPGTRCVLKFVRSRETNTKSKIRRPGILIRLMPNPAKTVLWALSCLELTVAQTVLSVSHQVWYLEEMRRLKWLNQTPILRLREALKSLSLARLRLVLQVAKLKALLRIFWNQVVHPQVAMQAQNRLLTIQISQMQISRLRPMSMVIRKPLILQTIRLRTLSLSRKLLGNGSISLIMPRMLF